MPTDPALACFASGSIAAAWSTNGTLSTVVSVLESRGALVVSGLRTGFDVQCNGAAGTSRLPSVAQSSGVGSVVLADVVGSDGAIDAVLIVGTAGLLEVGIGDGDDRFSSIQVTPPPH